MIGSWTADRIKEEKEEAWDSGRIERSVLRKHWYYITEYYCPICGKGKKYKERKYNKKPKDYIERNVTIESYDGCQG